jgi:hypothetical protein
VTSNRGEKARRLGPLSNRGGAVDVTIDPESGLGIYQYWNQGFARPEESGAQHPNNLLVTARVLRTVTIPGGLALPVGYRFGLYERDLPHWPSHRCAGEHTDDALEIETERAQKFG